MADLTATDIADLVAVTLRDLGEMRFQQIAQELVHFEVFSKWFVKDKVVFDSGIGIQRNLMNRVSTAARHSGWFETDATNIEDVLDQMQVDWRHMDTNWGMQYQTDILMNSGKAMILNVIEPRRASAMLGMVQEIEDRAWDSPPTTSDKILPFGIQYWVTAASSNGFNGGVPSGHTTVGGVSLDDSPTFKNYTVRYVAFSKADAIKSLRTAHRNIKFRSPISENDYRGGIGERYRCYTNESVISSIEDVGEGQNENLGRDVASMDGQMVFKRHPIVFVPKLDDRSDGPFYLIDHSTFYPVCLEGDYLRESNAIQNPNNHNIFQVFVDLTYNYVCIDRRRNALANTA